LKSKDPVIRRFPISKIVSTSSVVKEEVRGLNLKGTRSVALVYTRCYSRFGTGRALTGVESK
jgi:hypothetical protein